MSLHLVFVQIQGVSAPDSYYEQPAEERKSIKFFSEFLISEIPFWLAMGALLAFLATFLPRGLAPEADPTAPAPANIKPDWYFLSQYQALKLFPGKLEHLGQLVLAGIPLLALVLPFVDRARPADARGKWVAVAGWCAVVVLIGMTIWGWVS